MPEYGLKIGNLPRITGDRRIMRLLTMGDTQAVSGSRHKFRLHCQHADFCVYFRPLHQGVATASQIIHAVGGGVYDAYLLARRAASMCTNANTREQHQADTVFNCLTKAAA